MNSLFNSLYQAQAGARHGLDLEGRAYMPYLGVVTTNIDPLKRRRIKVSDPAVPALETDWLRRLQPFPQSDPPLPEIGSTVMVFCVDGDPLNGWYLQCVNDTNQPANKGNVLEDLHESVPGDQQERTDGDRVIKVGKSLTLQTDSGSSIALTESGDVIISDASGNSIILSGGISVDTSSFQVGNKEIATVDALDNGGHVLINKGWT